MTRIAYVNGEYLPRAYASVHIEDRGYQFADGVYEVIAFFNRTLVDGDLHIKRLQRSMKELGIASPVSERVYHIILQELMARNPLTNGMLYVQVSRGVQPRDHVVGKGSESALVATLSRIKPVNKQEMTKGTAVVTRPDIRWQRRDIKSIALLPNALLKNEVAKLGKREAWLLDSEGLVNEGSVSNAYIITKDGTIVTRGEGEYLLSGITRHRVLALAKEIGIKVEERAFTPKEAAAAKEAFLTSSTSHIVPVVQIGDKQIGDGKLGDITMQLFEAYVDYIAKETGKTIWPI